VSPSSALRSALAESLPAFSATAHLFRNENNLRAYVGGSRQTNGLRANGCESSDREIEGIFGSETELRNGCQRRNA
jgi:hypothetical protein